MTPLEPILPPVPDSTVVLTFDDGNRSDLELVAPRLAERGFGATFFITNDERICGDKTNYLKWSEVKELDAAGFEIGNHMIEHADVSTRTRVELETSLRGLEDMCAKWGIRPPCTFCYPGYATSRECAEVLRDHGYLFARRGCEPVSTREQYGHGGRGPAYDLQIDPALLVPTTGAAGPNWGEEDLRWAIDQARDGRVAVLTFHGVPDSHPHCSTAPGDFERYLQVLVERNCKVIALGELKSYVAPGRLSSN
ncbi:MAG: polysaccharide deacetylase family protein [Candidatus Latescibacterota bacterium]|nr:polysaccharide deacetylase family protein [Candidatus Latescibacterota bacterium]